MFKSLNSILLSINLSPIESVNISRRILSLFNFRSSAIDCRKRKEAKIEELDKSNGQGVAASARCEFQQLRKRDNLICTAFRNTHTQKVGINIFYRQGKSGYE